MTSVLVNISGMEDTLYFRNAKEGFRYAYSLARSINMKKADKVLICVGNRNCYRRLIIKKNRYECGTAILLFDEKTLICTAWISGGDKQ